MHSLGISVYPDKSDIKEVYEYMETAAKLGFSRIFTCFLSIPDDKRESYLKEFKGFMDKAHELGFVVAADTNPEVFKLIGATPNNLKPFADLGLDIIRLDGNFGTQGDIAVTRNPYGIKIEFNASMDAGVDLLIKNGGNKDQIIMCHNFFPERYTGLDFDLFQQFNKQWKALNLHTAAFVSSHNDPTIGPWEVFCGLPTVEIMRPLPIEVQARYLLATGDVDDIIIGNYPASTEELEALSKINFQALELRVDEVPEITDNEKYIMYEFAPHWDRYDHSSFMLRSSFPRLQFKNQATVQDSGFGDKKEAKEDKSIPHHDCGKKVFTRGDVLVVNDNFGTQGDIAVTRNPYGIKIEFNASMDAGVDLLIKNGGNKDQIIMCHNFFPERYTGLDFDLFQQFNKQWKALNLHTAAFVSSHNDPTIGPWEVFCGLPTVEIMRPLPIEVQARYLLATGDVDDIIIGNYPASTEELEALSKINFQALELRVDEVPEITDNEKYIMYEFAPHWDRYDHSSFMLRSSFPRLQFKNQATVQDSGFGDKKEAKEDKSIPHHDCGKKVFTRGDVLVVNDNLAHYRGELEVVLTEIPNDGERNLIGKIKDEDLGLLDFIKPGQHFKFIK